jgi:MYXO-CTERM domain-containing protein
MGRNIAWVLSTLVLLTSGVLGIYNGATGFAGAQTPFQYSVTVGVVLYGALGLAGAVALAARRRISVWLSAAWAIVVIYVASTAALAYAGAEATLLGALAGGFGAMVIGAGVVATALAVTRGGGSASGAIQLTQ